MKPLVILIIFLIGIVGLLGYVNYKQDKSIQELLTELANEPAEIEFEWIEPVPPPTLAPQIDRFIEIDILGEIEFIPIDSEGRVKFRAY